MVNPYLRFMALLAFVLAWAPATSANGVTWERETRGACEIVYGGEVCTWSRQRGDWLLEFGATVSLATVENAPLQGEMVFPPESVARIPLPEHVREQTGVDHLGINWEMHGHPPGPFLTPHFDFHFYTVSYEDVAGIDCSDRRKPALLPVDYVLPDLEVPDMGTMVGLCVPRMGMHALHDADLMATSLFEASILLGYYAGDLVFLEPMISRARLLERVNFDLPVPQLPGSSARAHWPLSMGARFDERTQAWRLAFRMGPVPRAPAPGGVRAGTDSVPY